MGKKIFKKFPKIVFFWLLIILILELSLFLVLLFKAKTPVEKPARKATLSLEPAQGSFKVGETFIVGIILDTGDYETDATDVRLKFDPQVLKVEKIENGEIYDSYPAKRTDEGKGIIIVNAITSLAESFKGRDVFAKIFFKGLKPGNVSLIFEFTPSSTIDSNVVASNLAKDILTDVEGSSLEIVK